MLDWQRILYEVQENIKEGFEEKRHLDIKKKVNKEIVASIRADVKKELELEHVMLKKQLIAAAEKDLEAKTQRLRDLVDSKLRPEFQRRFEQEKRQELRQEIKAELRPFLLAKIRDEERGLLKKQVEDELRPFLLAKVREEEKDRMKVEVEAALRTVIEQEMQEMRESNETQDMPRRKELFRNSERSTGRATNKKGKRAVVGAEIVPREDSIVLEEEAEVEREGSDNNPREENVSPVFENDPRVLEAVVPAAVVPEVVVPKPDEGNVEESRGILREDSVEHQNTTIDESPGIDTVSMKDSAFLEEERLARQREREFFLKTLDMTGEEEIQEEDTENLGDYIDGDDGDEGRDVDDDGDEGDEDDYF